MMQRALLLGVLLVIPAAAGADEPGIRVGITPFDVGHVSGATPLVGAAVGEIVRGEMARQRRLRPELLSRSGPSRPDGAAGVEVVLIGTVLGATASGPRLSAAGLSLRRTTAEVSLRVRLVDPATAEVVGSFDATGKETTVGIGADLITVAGSLSRGDGRWEDSPMGKALRKAAAQIAEETARRTERRRGDE